MKYFLSLNIYVDKQFIILFVYETDVVVKIFSENSFPSLKIRNI